MSEDAPSTGQRTELDPTVQAPAGSSALSGVSDADGSKRSLMWTGRAFEAVHSVFIRKVERDHRQPDHEFRRRRIVVGLTLVVGATLLGLSFSTEPGDAAFYPLTFGLAATWVLGSLLSGPIYLGRIEWAGNLRRPIITPIIVGLMLATVFIVGALVIRQIPPLAVYTQDVLGYASGGIFGVIVVITLVNGIAEELFFRGALFAAIGVKHPVLISTFIYAVATVAGGNPVLVFAAAVLGAVVGLQRRAAGGVLGPILTHVTWSMTMLFVLPPLFAGV